MTRRLAIPALTLATAVALFGGYSPATAAPDGPPASFHRINVDTAVTGASFTSVGEVFEDEKNIVTSGFGASACTACRPAAAPFRSIDPAPT